MRSGEAIPWGTRRHTTGPLIFVNYDGLDEPFVAAFLYRELVRLFGDESTFFDYESMPVGTQKFDQRLLTAVRRSSVMVSVIGCDWLAGISDGREWVQKEIAAAFRAEVTVVPLLVGAATMPSRSALPAGIRKLTTCQYRHLRHRSAGQDLTDLTRELLALEPRLAPASRFPNTA